MAVLEFVIRPCEHLGEGAVVGIFGFDGWVVEIDERVGCGRSSGKHDAA